MRTPLVLLKAIGKAVLNAIGGGVLGDILLDALPEIANNTWEVWSRSQEAAARRAELEALAGSIEAELGEQIEGLVRELAPDAPPESRRAVADYLKQVPAAIRRSLRRPEDPSGTTVPAGLMLRKGEDLLPFLPTRMPLFKPGDRPLSGVDWVLAELLGAGGFGEVWKAVHAHFQSFDPVALKFCTDPTARQRLLHHEATVCDQVRKHGRHPGIVALEQTYLSADPPCLQYEYVAGGDLAGLILEWYRTGSSPTPEEAARVVLRLCETVGYFHRLTPRIIHRDLKPANILTKRLEDGKVCLKIADFGIGGIASAQAVQVSRRGAGIGYMMTSLVRGSCTPMYASPRQLHGADADPWDDVHALGVIWHQILTGNLGQGRPTCSRRWHQGLAARGMSTALIDLLESCFEEDPSDHSADAAELAERLATALSPPHPGPPPQGGREEGISPSPLVGEGRGGGAEQGEPRGSGPAPRSPAEVAQAPKPAPVPHFTNSLGMTMVRIEPGDFLMGSTREQIDLLLKQFPGAKGDWLDWEQPQHPVRITKPFYLAAHPVTVGQYREFVDQSGHMAGNGWRSPGFHQGDNHPVVHVSHDSAVAFLSWLNAQEKDQNHGYRLPTEAEWEYACRAGGTGVYGSGDDPAGLDRIAWFSVNSGGGTHPVGVKEANQFGLHDMLGNVWEWCDDWFDENFYQSSPRDNPHNAKKAPYRVFRGGSWGSNLVRCRPAYRGRGAPGYRSSNLGFRVAAVQ